jgi:hypothetical protein
MSRVTLDELRKLQNLGDVGVYLVARLMELNMDPVSHLPMTHDGDVV